MNKKTLGGVLGSVCATAAIVALSTAPAFAVPSGQVEHCADGLVLVHSSGSSVWAASGDAKYQLVSIDGTVTGEFYNKKTGELEPFADSFTKTWTSSKKDVVETCEGTNHEVLPNGGFDDVSFTAELRLVK